MTNELTKVIMENIIEKCDDNKKKKISKMHINDREASMIKSIINKEYSCDIKAGFSRKINNKLVPKYITLDDLINKSR